MDAPTVGIHLTTYHEFIDQPKNLHRIFEYIEGEFVEKMGSFLPSKIAALLATYLNLHNFEHPNGHITGADGGYALPDGSVLIPDVGYIRKTRLTEIPEREVLTYPDLAIEVKSAHNTKRELRQKAERYLRNGTQVVWLVFPEEDTVEVYEGAAEVLTLGKTDILDGGSLLAGFQLPLAQIFPD